MQDRETSGEENLEDIDNWDLETSIPYDRPSEPSRRALVSIPFQPDEFQRVSEGASRAGEKLSVFVRTSALEKADAIIEAQIYSVSYSDMHNTFTIIFEDTPVFPLTESEKYDSGLPRNSPVVTASS